MGIRGFVVGLAVASLVAAGGIEPASAHARDLGSSGTPETVKVQAWVVGTYTSTPGESRAAFVRRVAEVLKHWASTTGTEAGGAFARLPDGRLTITLVTQKSQVVTIIPATAPPGAVLIGASIHDHPIPASKSGMVRLTAADEAAEIANGAGAVCDWSQRTHCWVSTYPRGFSPDDYAGGAGYLVVGDTLLYQRGEGTARVVDAHL